MAGDIVNPMERIYLELAMEERDYRHPDPEPWSCTDIDDHMAWVYAKRRAESAAKRATEAANRRKRRIKEAVAARLQERRAQQPLWRKVTCGIFG